jgi:hypothetical protein
MVYGNMFLLFLGNDFTECSGEFVELVTFVGMFQTFYLNQAVFPYYDFMLG